MSRKSKLARVKIGMQAFFSSFFNFFLEAGIRQEFRKILWKNTFLREENKEKCFGFTFKKTEGTG